MTTATDSTADHVAAILGAVDRYDSLECLSALRAAAASCPSEILVSQILAPLLHEAGARWRNSSQGAGWMQTPSLPVRSPTLGRSPQGETRLNGRCPRPSYPWP